jgi:predicted RecB family nuclease
MKITPAGVRLSATDLGNHLACHHLTSLDLGVAHGRLQEPEWRSPDLAVIQELGLRHEAAYLQLLRDQRLAVVDLREMKNDEQALLETHSCMERGAEVIAQGSIAAGRWFGRPDVLRRVAKKSGLGPWSYEAYDCKLSSVTKGETILQLALYSALLAETQGEAPEFMNVIPAGKNFEAERYRFAEYAAYYRYVKARLEKACDGNEDQETYPEPCAHCDICRWFGECDTKRRSDDHLSLVAGITKLQRKQFNEWQADTMEKLAILPIPLERKPVHGSKAVHERVREQARVQVEGRTTQQPVNELLPAAEGTGLCRLPEPSAMDVFVDLEGDPYAGEGGHQYLFGLVAKTEKGELAYENKWCLNPDEEKAAFEWTVDEIMRRFQVAPAMHVYHFGAYEPAQFKRLMGRYAVREDEVDRMLRAELFVDLHAIFKQSVRASVEEYSLKALEVFHSFVRNTPLVESRAAMRYVEHWLELEWGGELPAHVRRTIAGYNEDDCRSAAALREWLEERRRRLEADGTPVPRPFVKEGAPSEELDEQQKRVAALVARLTDGIPVDRAMWSSEQSALWKLAQLMDWHRRENKATFWEGFRLAALDDDALIDERTALSGLRFAQRLAVERQIPTDRYEFDRQETELRSDKDVYHSGQKIGCVVAIDVVKRTVDIKKTRKTADAHPRSVYMWDRPYDVSAQAEVLLRIGDWVHENGVDAPGRYRAARDLLLKKPPRIRDAKGLEGLPGEGPLETACRVVKALDESVFAIQGPPGAGKTYTGGWMICELIRAGKKVGVTALGHKVIRKLLEQVIEAARDSKFQGVKCMQRWDKGDGTDDIAIARKNDEAWAALRSGSANVVGGTSWLWAPEESFEAVDVLFVDEAGQMALADMMTVAHAAHSLVLIGDPQQLERPVKGSHPEGADESALEHLIGKRNTISPELGMLLPETWRMHPNICSFTSELFYDGRLGSRDFTRNRVLEGHPWLNGAGLWFVPVEHDGNRHSSAEEVEVIARMVESLLRPEVRWFYGIGNSRKVKYEDILIVAPYNAQVSDLLSRLPGAAVGTVDKFQGQEAAVVIFSLTTSSPEDAPRGMEFLYSLNRFNVATSRGMSAVIVVGSPRLFEPECRSPRQMQLANAFCRFLEMARVIEHPI